MTANNISTCPHPKVFCELPFRAGNLAPTTALTWDRSHARRASTRRILTVPRRIGRAPVADRARIAAAPVMERQARGGVWNSPPGGSEHEVWGYQRWVISELEIWLEVVGIMQ